MRVADVEGAGRIVGAVGEELERGGRALDALHRGASHNPGRQVLEHLEADALGHVIERLLHQRRIVRRRHQRCREYAGRSVDTNGFDAARRDEAQVVGEPQLVEKITGGPFGARLAEKAAGIARRVDLLVLELPPTTLTSVPSGVAIGRNWISLLASWA